LEPAIVLILADDVGYVADTTRKSEFLRKVVGCVVIVELDTDAIDASRRPCNDVGFGYITVSRNVVHTEEREAGGQRIDSRWLDPGQELVVDALSVLTDIGLESIRNLGRGHVETADVGVELQFVYPVATDIRHTSHLNEGHGRLILDEGIGIGLVVYVDLRARRKAYDLELPCRRIEVASRLLALVQMWLEVLCGIVSIRPVRAPWIDVDRIVGRILDVLRISQIVETSGIGMTEASTVFARGIE